MDEDNFRMKKYEDEACCRKNTQKSGRKKIGFFSSSGNGIQVQKFDEVMAHEGNIQKSQKQEFLGS